jgi:hypothetical protein
MSKIVIELTADEARTVSRGLFRAHDSIEGPFTSQLDYAIRACAKVGTTPDGELANLKNVEARVDAALNRRRAGGHGGPAGRRRLIEDLTGVAH